MRLQPEAGRRSPLTHRLGVDIPRWRGENTENDGGGLLPDEFQVAINVRILPNGMIVNRGGQERSIEDAMDDCVNQIIDDELGNTNLLTVSGASDGADADFLYSLNPYVNKVGEDGLLVDATKILTPLTDGRILAVMTYEGTFYYLVCSPTNAVTVYVATRDDMRGGRPGTILGAAGSAGAGTVLGGSLAVFQNLLWVGFGWTNGSTSFWRIQSVDLMTRFWTTEDSIDDATNANFRFPTFVVDQDDNLFAVANGLEGGRLLSSGSWSTVPLPTEYVGAFAAADVISFAGRTFIGGGNVVLEWDGAALAVLNEMGDATLTGFAGLGDYLYYTWYQSEGGLVNVLQIGRFDGITWENEGFMNFGLESLVDPPDKGSLMRAYDGKLYIVGNSVDTAEGYKGVVWTHTTEEPGIEWALISRFPEFPPPGEPGSNGLEHITRVDNNVVPL